MCHDRPWSHTRGAPRTCIIVSSPIPCSFSMLHILENIACMGMDLATRLFTCIYSVRGFMAVVYNNQYIITWWPQIQKRNLLLRGILLLIYNYGILLDLYRISLTTIGLIHMQTSLNYSHTLPDYALWPCPDTWNPLNLMHKFELLGNTALQVL